MSASPSSLAFTGEMTDDPTGLIYLRARYYHPASGTFLTQDPVMGVVGGPASTFNPYLYVRGNPVNWTDPSGRIAPLLLLFAGAAALGGLAAGIADILLNGNYCFVRTSMMAMIGLAGAGLLAIGGAALGLAAIARLLPYAPFAPELGKVVEQGTKLVPEVQDALGGLSTAVANIVEVTSGSSVAVEPIGRYAINGLVEIMDPVLEKSIGLGGISTDGFLEIAIYTSDTGTSVRGSEVFSLLTDMLLESPEGALVNGLRGIWHGGSSNIETFNRLIQEGVSLEDAAMQTFTGKMASRNLGYVFDAFELLKMNVEGIYTDVIVTFKAPWMK